MTTFNLPIDVQQMLKELPEEIDRIILEALSAHVGRDKALSRKRLVARLSPTLLQRGICATSRMDRSIRLAINRLRKNGYPICSTGGVRGGYFIAATPAELNDYLSAEVHSRAMDLLEQERAMRAGANRLWSLQPSLF